MDQRKVGVFIRQCRTEKGLTQAQLAEVCGVTDKAVSKWENGRSCPDASIMVKLCECLGISVNELLSGERIRAEDASDPSEGPASANELDTAVRRKWMIYFFLCPVLYFILRLLSDGTASENSLRTTVVIGLSCVSWLLIWLLVFRGNMRRGSRSIPSPRSFLRWYNVCGALSTLVLFFVLAAVFSVRANRQWEEGRIPVTAENSPANLFLTLSADTSPEDILDAAADYGWYVIEYSLGYQITVNEDVLFFDTAREGVCLYLVFSPESELESALLFIKTRRGTATCTYDPGTEVYSASVKKALRERDAAFASAQEAVDYMYPYVCPELTA